MTERARRETSWGVASGIAVTLATIAIASCAGREARSGSDAERAFETVRAVLQHPRCLNCHPAGDAPLQLDAGVVHAQNILRGKYGLGVPGLPCSSCHGATNLPDSYGTQMPPGAPNWHMPPPSTKMVFEGVSASALAAQLRDPRATGGKSFDQLVEHVEHDPLVLWGWNPGAGRAPVPIPHRDFVEAFRIWVRAGAPLPSE